MGPNPSAARPNRAAPGRLERRGLNHAAAGSNGTVAGANRAAAGLNRSVARPNRAAAGANRAAARRGLGFAGGGDYWVRPGEHEWREERKGMVHAFHE